jgi:hypothetical protein
MLWSLTSCQREWLSPRPGELRWAPDTVRFDSLFSTILSPTKRLWIYNPHLHPVRLQSIYLEKGAQSPFRFIWNGRPGPLLSIVEVPSKDSVQVFLSLQDSAFYDQTREDHLILEVAGGGTQRIPLRATLVAAYVYRDFGFDSLSLSLPSDKPIVIDGYFYVGPAATLRIVAGTRLYFSGKRWASGPLQGELASGLYVAGRLEVLGTSAAPVQMQGWRLEKYYASASGQWMGLWLFPSAGPCEIHHAHIRQASIGIRIDSVGPSIAPKLRLESTLIADASNYGVLALGFGPTPPSAPILRMVNALIYRCGQAPLRIAGGGYYELIHSTLIFDQGDLRRGQTALVVSDYLRTQSGLQTYPLRLFALNTLLWSTKPNAYLADLQGPNPDITFDHCALRQEDHQPSGPSNLYLSNPGLGSDKEAYPLLQSSPLIDKGRYDPVYSPAVDRLGKPRDAQPDIGCYEYLR